MRNNPFLAGYFSLCRVVGHVPEAPPPLSCDGGGAAGQGSVLLVGPLFLHLRHKITQRTCFWSGSLSSLGAQTELLISAPAC